MTAAVWQSFQLQGGRDYQEDFFAVVESNRVVFMGQTYAMEGALPDSLTLYVLADGMGGEANGAQAASTVTETFIESFLNNYHALIESRPVSHILKISLDSANQTLEEIANASPENRGMGCTFIGLLVDRNKRLINWISVGDSILAVVNETGYQQINEKHTYFEQVKREKAQGYEFDDAAVAEKGHRLTSAVMGMPLTEVDNRDETFALEDGDIIVVASDGIESIDDFTRNGILNRGFDSIRNELLGQNLTDNKKQLIGSMVEQLESKITELNLPGQDNTTLIAVGL